jgi:beta-glucosidase
MKQFPKKFIWGAATAAYQIEGATAEEGRGASIWDTYSHIPGNVNNNENGDIACDHYHKYKEDVQIMKEMGLKGYRFSISWSRIFPQGYGKINQKGIDFYNSLIDELLKNKIEPIATLYHWDLPQALQDIGGWGNREIIEYFNEYANCMYKNYGDRVKKWITLNEPFVTAFIGNFIGRHAPGFKDLSLAVQVSHHLILSHARAVESYKILNEREGRIGIALDLHPISPATDLEDDKEASVLSDDYHNRWFLDPVLKGKYPEKLFNLYKENINSPVILSNDMDIISKNRCDFLGINYYFRMIIKKSDNHPILRFENIMPIDAIRTEMDWEVYPKGIYDLLIKIKNEYNNPEVYITENGAAFKDDKFKDGIIDDKDRLDYIQKHIKELHNSIKDGVNLKGYYLWSLMDNFEWAYGFSKRFGLIRVDYNTQERIWKKSAFWYKEFIKNNGL